jgi:hypothetical protein
MDTYTCSLYTDIIYAYIYTYIYTYIYIYREREGCGARVLKAACSISAAPYPTKQRGGPRDASDGRPRAAPVSPTRSPTCGASVAHAVAHVQPSPPHLSSPGAQPCSRCKCCNRCNCYNCCNCFNCNSALNRRHRAASAALSMPQHQCPPPPPPPLPPPPLPSLSTRAVSVPFLSTPRLRGPAGGSLAP